MSCPTCDHTMQHVAGTGRVFWCPRCGTLADVAFGSAEGNVASVPKLVERCRAFEGGLRNEPLPHHTAAGIFYGLNQVWNAVGIHESINLPGERHGDAR